MRLLNTTTLRLEAFYGTAKPKYAILSHTWGDEEVLFRDLDPSRNPENGRIATTKKGLGKVLGSAAVAKAKGFDYIWIDTCCIDKSSSAELSEAINSMFRWYSHSALCCVYMVDVSWDGSLPLTDAADHSNSVESFRNSRWFRRGWTLQELVAPTIIDFYNRSWEFIGDKLVLADSIASITGIPVGVIHGRNVRTCSVSTRMSWAALRETTRVEDIAYSLMGLFGVNMPLLYGEGHKAFARLQEEIARLENDQTILAHKSWDLFALKPDDFLPNLTSKRHAAPVPAMEVTSNGIKLDLLLSKAIPRSSANLIDSAWIGILHCNFADDYLARLGLWLEAVDVNQGTFRRFTFGDSLVRIDPSGGLAATWPPSSVTNEDGKLRTTRDRH
jgi:hypothetical protein